MKYLYHFLCDCGGKGFVSIDEKDQEFICYDCKKTKKITSKDFAKVGCDNCIARYDITVLNKCNITKCKKCKSPVDLIWNKKKGYFVSGDRK